MCPPAEPPDHDLLSVDREVVDPDTVVVRPRGEVDSYTVGLLARALDAALSGHARVVVDLTAVGFLASRGVLCLVDAAARASRDGKTLLLAAPRGHRVVRIVRLVGPRLVVWHRPLSELSPMVGEGRGACAAVEPGPTDPGSRETVAMFVAWLATQILEQDLRRRHREIVERYLVWARSDTGPSGDRSRRYQQQCHDLVRAQVGEALDLFTNHQMVLAATRIPEPRAAPPRRRAGGR